MFTSTKKEKKAETEQEVSIRDKMQVQDFMPGWAKEENCFIEAGTLIDVNTGRMTDRHWPRAKPIEQLVYEQWLDKVVNQTTGKWNNKRYKDGNVIKGTGAKYLISVIYRIKVDKQEFLITKGFLKGYDVAGTEVVHWITYPERWTRTMFNYRRYFDEKTRGFQSQLLGPSGSETVYDLPFSPQNVDKLWEQTDKDKDNVKFVVKDQQTGESVEVSRPLSLLKERPPLKEHCNYSRRNHLNIYSVLIINRLQKRSKKDKKQ
jgi:hypothetical protein